MFLLMTAMFLGVFTHTGSCITLIPEGSRLPDFSLPDSSGSIHSPDEYKGKITVWLYLKPGQEKSRDLVSNCMKCLDHFPRLQAVAIVMKRVPDDFTSHLSFPVLLDEQRQMYASWNARVFPTIILVNPEGIIVRTWSGYSKRHADELMQEIRLLMGEITDDDVSKLELRKNHQRTPGERAGRFVNLARMLIEKGQTGKAARELKKAIQADSLHRPAYMALGDLELQHDNPAGALEAYQRARDITDDPEVQLQIARSFLRLGDANAAIIMLEVALAAHPRSPKILVAMARAEISTNQLDDAEGLLKDLLLLKPDHAQAIYLLGSIAELRGDFITACKHYRHALTLVFE